MMTGGVYMETKNIIVFLVKEKEFALPLEKVQSIEKVEEISSVENGPDYLQGMADIRGDLIPVIDGRKLFFDETEGIAENSRLILLNTEPHSVAILVSAVKEIVSIQDTQLKKVSFIQNKRNKYFTGVVHIDERLILFIDPEYFLDAIDSEKQLIQIKEDLIQAAEN